ncbi:uncharacterized protein LOC143026849 [Oratosquilla oratoria]|uniref:uncharacterized protein LOC143026849 n=1 Tax=Oratosquilla oratoria TaxID=337810 RepID=UPI003F76AA37
MFDKLELFQENIEERASEKFMQHYFAKHMEFVKNGGKADHRNYQMNYLDRAFHRSQRAKRGNKYTIKKVREKALNQRKLNMLREAEEKAKQREEQKKLNKRQQADEKAKQREEQKKFQKEEKERRKLEDKELAAKKLRVEKRAQEKQRLLEEKENRRKARVKRKYEKIKTVAVAKRVRAAVRDETKIRSQGLLANCIAYVLSIEYQKRGLPHLHYLLWMDEESKPRYQNYDDYVQAEIPSRDEDPEGYALVLKHMIHGPNCNGASPCWRNESCSKRKPAVVRLQVHLPDLHLVYIKENNDRQPNENASRTTLTEFFNICQYDEFARTIYYSDAPKYYVWENKKWQRRKEGRRVVDHPEVFEANILTLIYTVSPNSGELYYLRLLLHHVKGPNSFESLQTVEGQVYPSFKAACKERGLLLDDNHWLQTMEDAERTRLLRAMRDLFTQANDQNMLINKNAINNTLRYIQDTLCATGKSLPDFELPLPQNQPNVIHCLDTGSSSLIFIDAPGGTGKTSLLKLILSKVRSSGQIALDVASSGIAATLMPGGRNAHSKFKLPLNVGENDFFVKRGNNTDVYDACIKESYLWRKFTKFHLKRNVRVQEEGDEYSQFLIKIGEDKIKKNGNDEIALPVDMIIPASNVDQCIEYIYPSFDNSVGMQKSVYWCHLMRHLEQQIISVLKHSPEKSKNIFSFNSVCVGTEATHYPTEFLDSLELSELPPHKLELKKGAPIMCMRNIDPPRLCNKTRLKIEELYDNLLFAKIIASQFRGVIVLIQRLNFFFI